MHILNKKRVRLHIAYLMFKCNSRRMHCKTNFIQLGIDLDKEMFFGILSCHLWSANLFYFLF